MSVQFGKCNLDGKPVDTQELDRVRSLLAPYGPDGEGLFRRDNVEIIYRAFHTTKESRLENQPCITSSGAIITWDGRLDNREDLISQLGGDLSTGATDLSMVERAYERWGPACFDKFAGDWAMSIWSPSQRTLLLAKDVIGTRHLYYFLERDSVTWSTTLDPLVLFTTRSFTLEEEYLAGWLSSFPASHLTPYSGIRGVPPASFVAVKVGQVTVHKYWDFNPDKIIRYRADAEYEDHFRNLFADSVLRRLRSDSPIVAELSGGMDSSSIVCMADNFIGRDPEEAPRVETISYYDDSEPNWDERPYFSKVEERRGRVGCHINVGSDNFFRFAFEPISFAATPGSSSRPPQVKRQLIDYMASRRSRVLLSGVGGDEVAGGVPTPTPEIADLIAGMCVRRLANRLKLWALNKRMPWFYLLLQAIRQFLPPPPIASLGRNGSMPWLCPDFAKRNRRALNGYKQRLRLLGSRPSFQENLRTLESLRRQIACNVLSRAPLYEKRYPYLDRDLLEFIYAIPREQLVRPGQRRSLMRRAFAGLLPKEILDRTRKAFVDRSPARAWDLNSEGPIGTNPEMLLAKMRIVDSQRFLNAIQEMSRGVESPVVNLLRTLCAESWLRHLEKNGFLKSLECAFSVRCCAEIVSAPDSQKSDPAG